VVTYTTKVLIPIKLVLKRVQEFLPLTGVSKSIPIYLDGSYQDNEVIPRKLLSCGYLEKHLTNEPQTCGSTLQEML